MKSNLFLYFRFSLMMFFQYMLFAVWWVPLAAYLANMGLSRTLTALILSSMAIGCMASPIVGMVADRYFRGQVVLAVTNFIVGVMLLFAGLTSNPVLLFVFLLTAMIFYMPSWGLTSSITMKHVDSDIFPRIRVFGAIGWVFAGVFSLFTVRVIGVDFDGTHIPFLYAAGIAVVAGLFNLGLPDTPPPARGEKASLIDIMGFRSIKLMKDRNFAVFIFLSFFAMIPFSMYWSYFSEFLADSGFRFISLTMNMGQMLEIFILLAVPISIKKYGLRRTMIIGLVALVIRYGSLVFADGNLQLPMILTAVFVHGIIFGFFYLGGQIYIDRKAPAGLRSQGQGFIFFVTFGAGLLAGNFISGQIIGIFSTEQAGITVYQWDTIWSITTAMAVLCALAFIFLFRKEDYGTIELEQQ
ncbi:MAG: MFS transporter [Marinilabiliales bacterium]|nr:MAG: MFS transporter [Marinilabiliales bacterium]